MNPLNKKAAFIGLGVMGYPMAGHLARRAGLAMCVYNRSALKAGNWIAEYGGASAPTPAQAAQGSDIVFLCVGNDDDLRAVLTGPDGVIEGAAAGTIIIDHTTVSADIAREMAGLFAQRGDAFIDAPVSGGQAGAQNGALTVMCGGDADAFATAEPVIRAAYAKECRLMGPAGAGQLTKMVNQICIAGVVQGLAEGLTFGLKAGLDMDAVIEVIGQGAAQSWQLDNRGKTMVRDQFDFGFALDWMIKDLGIALAEAQRSGADLTGTQTILDYYRELSAAGHGSCDTSALIKRLVE